MKTSINGLHFISNWEGCVLSVYKDIAGLPTIGIGHLIKSGENFTTISKDQALDLLANDVVKCEVAVNSLIKVDLNQNQFDALVSWSFNCGTGVLKSSTLALRLNAGHYDEVAGHLLNWCKYTVVENGVKVVKTNQGLLNRRKSEADLWNTAVVEPVVDGNGLLTQNEIDALMYSVQRVNQSSIDDLFDDVRNIHNDELTC